LPPCNDVVATVVCPGCHGDQSQLNYVVAAVEESSSSTSHLGALAVDSGASLLVGDNDGAGAADSCRDSVTCGSIAAFDCRLRAGWSIADVIQTLGVLFQIFKEYSSCSAALCGVLLLVFIKFRKKILFRIKHHLSVGKSLVERAIGSNREEEKEEREIEKKFRDQEIQDAQGGLIGVGSIPLPLDITSNDNTTNPSINMTITDEDGHMIIRKGDILQSRFEILGLLGEGTFGKVAEVRDFEAKNKKRALKVIRNIDKYREAAKLEIQILEAIAEKEETLEGRNLCLTHVDWFGYNGHICLAFELLGDSVFDFLKDNEYQPYTIEHTRHIMFQLISAVAFLHRLKITHTDLKPENLLFKNRGDFETLYTRKGRAYKKMKNTEVRLIDFGSATFDHDHHSTVVSTRHYRAPEVVLELGWSLPCDIWSIGCILFELCQGATMFQTHENKEHLAMMEQILGPIPYGMIKKTPKTKYFWRGRLDWDDRNEAGQYVKRQCRPLKENLGPSPDKDHRQMYDLMELMLEYNPDQRMSAEECLKHGFFEQITHNQRLTARAGGLGPSTKIH